MSFICILLLTSRSPAELWTCLSLNSCDTHIRGRGLFSAAKDHGPAVPFIVACLGFCMKRATSGSPPDTERCLFKCLFVSVSEPCSSQTLCDTWRKPYPDKCKPVEHTTGGGWSLCIADRSLTRFHCESLCDCISLSNELDVFPCHYSDCGRWKVKSSACDTSNA